MSEDDSKQYGIDSIAIPSNVDEPANSDRYLTGIRLALAVLGLGLTVFLPAAEISIVSTSLITVSEDLNGFDQSSWIITAYLSAFTGFILLWSKISTFFGLKPALIASVLLFMAFSAGCGAAKSVEQLIIMRAFQGITGAGAYSLPSIAFFQLVPPTQYNIINAVSSSTMAIALIISPIIGGSISQHDAWRWIFYLNLPAGGVAAMLLAFVLPARFPAHCEPPLEKHERSWRSTRSFFEKADLLGASLLLAAVIFLVAALEEGNVRFPWNSAIISSFLAVSGFLWIMFLLWNWCLMSAIFGCIVGGAPMTIAAIELPQRFQLVNESSPLDAGVRLLAFAVATPVGIVVASVLTGRLRIPFVYTLTFGACLQITGFTLISTVPTTVNLWNGMYGFCVLAGMGAGVTAGTFYVLTPISCEKEDQPLAVGLALQARMLGGAVGIAVVNSVWVNYVRSHLASAMSTAEIDELLSSIGSLAQYPQDLQTFIRGVCGEAYNLQMRATLGFSAAQFLAIAALWRKKPFRLSEQGTLE
ncbi:hypothetical protein TruAng_005844 [Truncatella angustata]|nr:hypothetical protein TruAng_005844 [Truncatella angustata]